MKAKLSQLKMRPHIFRQRYRETLYHITVLQTRNGSGEMSVIVDGVEQPDKKIPLVDDRREHVGEVRIDVAGK